ncbi:hypothetical protein Q1695_014620 [Nippostrongylus brasiliensis]|nr:hypothetical protein Q1695_014620 [Nippostrongylus brasiliensis]
MTRVATCRRCDRLSASFPSTADDAPLQGRDVKLLRDATSSVVTRVWSDSCAASSLLSQKINEGNEALAHRLNDSFTLEGRRLNTLPTISMFQADVPAPKMTSLSGFFDQAPQFSLRLRRLQDVMRMRPTPMSEEEGADFLVGHLDGVAREKVEELPKEARKDFNAIVSNIPAYFEGPDQRDIACQKLSFYARKQASPVLRLPNAPPVIGPSRYGGSGFSISEGQNLGGVLHPFTGRHTILREVGQTCYSDNNYIT